MQKPNHLARARMAEKVDWDTMLDTLPTANTRQDEEKRRWDLDVNM